MNLVSLIAPELVLIVVACGLFLLGVSTRAPSRRLAAAIAFVTLVAVFFWQLATAASSDGRTLADAWGTVTVGPFATYVKALVAGLGAILVLLAWPTNADATGSASMNFGHDAGEFYALMLLSLAGVFLVAGANDLILLFLGIELASIPTYIMVSISRPLPVAQEAGVKYFFLGAMAAAVMLFGFSYLYGTTGLTKLDQIADFFNASRGSARETWTMYTPASVTQSVLPGSGLNLWSAVPLNTWQLLGVVVILAGFAFKIAAVPFHAYAGDVYQGAATPVTAFLAFVPKTSGFVAIFKVLFAVGGPHWAVPPIVTTLLIIVAAFTMSVGNVLGLLQYNVKRVLAYSSIAHSGYMLVGVAALVHAPQLLWNHAVDAHGHPITPDAVAGIQQSALQGVLFYLAAYGLMNVGAFGVLMLLPSRTSSHGASATPALATTAETFEDIAGTGRQHIGLGLAMAVCCFSLIGLPLTVGFFGKFLLLKPALASGLFWLVVVMMANAAVSAAYYLRIVATMFLRPVPEAGGPYVSAAAAPARAASPFPTGGYFGNGRPPLPIAVAVAVSVLGTLVFGIVLPATNSLTSRTQAAHLDVVAPAPQSAKAPAPAGSAQATVVGPTSPAPAPQLSAR